MEHVYAAGFFFDVPENGEGQIEFETGGEPTYGGAMTVRIDTDAILILAGEILKRKLGEHLRDGLLGMHSAELMQVESLLGLRR